MKKSLNIAFALMCSATLFFVGCHKKETTEVDNETQSAVDNAVADQEYAAIVPTANSHAINTKGAGGVGRSSSMSPCDTLKWLNRATADTLPIHMLPNGNYSIAPVYELDLALASSACTGTNGSFTDGKIRVGKWNIRITAPLRNPNSQMILKLIGHKTIDATPTKTTTISYSCDSIVVTTVASSSVAPYPFITYNIKLTGGLCQTAAWVIKYNFDRTITTYPKGDATSAEDPITYVFGTASGVNRQSRAFNVNIPSTTPLVKRKSCQYVQKGIMDLTPDGFKTRTVDFGNGTCDDDATFTVNGNTVAFKLK